MFLIITEIVFLVMCCTRMYSNLDCGAPGLPNDGYIVSTSGTYFHDEVVYGCNLGYQVNGSQTIFCQYNGSWSNPAPICLSKLLTFLKFLCQLHYSLSAQRKTILTQF